MRCGKSTSSPTNDGGGKIVSDNEDQKLERPDGLLKSQETTNGD
jgi:hypothetical protein